MKISKLKKTFWLVSLLILMSGQLAEGAFPDIVDSSSICYEYGKLDMIDYDYPSD